ncbi:MAG: hypothetical protein P9L99_10425 [Candidatus Lernaella stagnicola]|nr:hypothetical protein [Candidatus Lernaella stagnicola]
MPEKLSKPVIALGGDLKCQPVYAAGDTAEVLPEIGDLASPDNQDALEDLVDRYEPELVVCDKHPGYFSTTLAERLAAERGLGLVKVQHHRAHVAAVAMEHGLFHEPIVGLAFDGTGYGDDAVAWGGEFFSGSVASGLARRAHMAPLPLPGGDVAVRAPWRIALATLIERGADDETINAWLESRGVQLRDVELFKTGLARKLAVGRSTSVGRWFDAVAALLGVRTEVEFEAQGAIELQQLAEANAYDVQSGDWPYAISEEEPRVVDFPAFVDIASRPAGDAPRLAYAFHVACAAAAAETAKRLADETGAKHVLVSGGVFFNRLLDGLLAERVGAHGLAYTKPIQLMPGDTAIALGQVGLVLAGTET